MGKQLAQTLWAVWLALTLAFFALRVLPGDAVENRLRQSATTPEAIAAQRARFGLDRPLSEQYGRYLVGLLRGDLGVSLVSREPVRAVLAARLVPTLQLAGAGLLVALGLGVALGSLSAAGRWSGFLGGAITSLMLAAPVYWTATLAIYLAAHPLKSLGLPSGGARGWQSLILPALVLGISAGGGIARVTENALRESFQQTYLQTARAKGLRTGGVWHHAWRPALPAILSITALQAGFMFSGTVMIETIFTRRGLGSLMVQAVLDQDYPVVQGAVLLAALGYALARGAAGILRKLADPRL